MTLLPAERGHGHAFTGAMRRGHLRWRLQRAGDHVRDPRRRAARARRTRSTGSRRAPACQGREQHAAPGVEPGLVRRRRVVTLLDGAADCGCRPESPRALDSMRRPDRLTALAASVLRSRPADLTDAPLRSRAACRGDALARHVRCARQGSTHVPHGSRSQRRHRCRASARRGSPRVRRRPPRRNSQGGPPAGLLGFRPTGAGRPDSWPVSGDRARWSHVGRRDVVCPRLRRGLRGARPVRLGCHRLHGGHGPGPRHGSQPGVSTSRRRGSSQVPAHTEPVHRDADDRARGRLVGPGRLAPGTRARRPDPGRRRRSKGSVRQPGERRRREPSDRRGRGHR